MAFIREYAMANELGDPFFRRLRKLRIGRALGKLGRGVLKVGRAGLGVASRLGALPGPLAGALTIARRFGLDAGDFDSDDDLYAFARQQGYELGDPGKRVPKRKSAAAGTRHKAGRKREVRRERRRGRLLGSIGRGIAGAGKVALEHAPELLALAGKGGGPAGLMRTVDTEDYAGIADELSALAPAAGMGRAPGGAPFIGTGPRGRPARVARYTKKGTITFQKRPTMQVTNTRALRRSLNRVEGFAKLSKRLMPHIWRSSSPRAGRKGHKAGCGCVACRRK